MPPPDAANPRFNKLEFLGPWSETAYFLHFMRQFKLV